MRTWKHMDEQSPGPRSRGETPRETAPASLGERIRPCGPVIDEKAAGRAREALGPSDAVDRAWPALAPVFAAAPYLARIAARRPERLAALLAAAPDASLSELLAEADAAGGLDPEDGGAALRRAKAELHLLTALCDLGGV